MRVRPRSVPYNYYHAFTSTFNFDSPAVISTFHPVGSVHLHCGQHAAGVTAACTVIRVVRFPRQLSCNDTHACLRRHTTDCQRHPSASRRILRRCHPQLGGCAYTAVGGGGANHVYDNCVVSRLGTSISFSLCAPRDHHEGTTIGELLRAVLFSGNRHLTTMSAVHVYPHVRVAGCMTPNYPARTAGTELTFTGILRTTTQPYATGHQHDLSTFHDSMQSRPLLHHARGSRRRRHYPVTPTSRRCASFVDCNHWPQSPKNDFRHVHDSISPPNSAPLEPPLLPRLLLLYIGALSGGPPGESVHLGHARIPRHFLLSTDINFVLIRFRTRTCCSRGLRMIHAYT